MSFMKEKYLTYFKSGGKGGRGFGEKRKAVGKTDKLPYDANDQGWISSPYRGQSVRGRELAG